MTGGGLGSDRFGELAHELENIGERLADLAMDLLREGLADGSEEAAAAATRREKQVNRARSSVIKAMSLLEKAADEPGEAGGDE